jgi:hypothetical protein
MTGITPTCTPLLLPVITVFFFFARISTRFALILSGGDCLLQDDDISFGTLQGDTDLLTAQLGDLLLHRAISDPRLRIEVANALPFVELLLHPATLVENPVETRSERLLFL